MPRGTGRFRRIIAGLLALALLVLPGGPLRQASAAPSGHRHAAHHCTGQDAAAPRDQRVAAMHDRDPGPPGDETCGGMPGLACCASAQCPATIAVPPATPAEAPPRSELRAVGFAAQDRPDGIPVDPALRPPRPVA
jgi:hypothetical protein